MTQRSSANSIDEYIAEFPGETRAVLEAMRALIRGAAPDATETISYAIPTFDLHGRHLVHFAGYEQHVGFYPGRAGSRRSRTSSRHSRTPRVRCSSRSSGHSRRP